MNEWEYIRLLPPFVPPKKYASEFLNNLRLYIDLATPVRPSIGLLFLEHSYVFLMVLDQNRLRNAMQFVNLKLITNILITTQGNSISN